MHAGPSVPTTSFKSFWHLQYQRGLQRASQESPHERDIFESLMARTIFSPTVIPAWVAHTLHLHSYATDWISYNFICSTCSEHSECVQHTQHAPKIPAASAIKSVQQCRSLRIFQDKPCKPLSLCRTRQVCIHNDKILAFLCPFHQEFSMQP